ncbi:MAG: rRNA pseudouridine synthase [Lachnospiraceae bacterium]|nr:rRNA pseudouridine synthase [Lachnospiraceae bacterium]
MGLLRLDKFLADSGIGTRSQVKVLIKKGKVRVDDNVIMSTDYKIDTESQKVYVENIPVNYNEFVYFMLNKPAGCVTATTDKIDKTVLDYLNDVKIKGLFPVGRLDKDTEGLLLITNDGELSHNLLSPKKHVEKTYFVRTDIPITSEIIDGLETGVDIGDDKPTLPAKVTYANDNKFETYISITEGRFHQVKRMYKAFGAEVIYLKRISMGSLKLDDDLALGEFRALSDDEINRLKS